MIHHDTFIKVRIGSELFQRFCRACQARGIKRSAVVRSLIETWIATMEGSSK
jgi:hypothetical protein